MSEAVRKRWVWELYPLDPRTLLLGNRLEDDNGVPAGTPYAVKIPYGRPYRSGVVILDTGEDHRGKPVQRYLVYQRYPPTEDDLAKLSRWRPGDDPKNPDWSEVEDDLHAYSGRSLEELLKMNARTLLKVLASLQTREPADGSALCNRGKAEGQTPSAGELAGAQVAKGNVSSKHATPIARTANWSKPTSKAGAATFIGISVDKIDDHLKEHPQTVHKISRQLWQFDKADSLFARLP